MEQCESTADKISNVTANVIEHILSFLPVKDAARTSLLSRNWRHHWRRIPQLVFDGSFAPLPDMGADLPNENKVMVNIYEALLVHDGPITKFELAIPGLRDCPQIGTLIRHLPSKGVQELAFRFSIGHTKLHSSLFSDYHLTVLKLQNCSFSAPSSFVGLSKLAILELKNVIMPEDFLKNIRCQCPLLEDLRVLNCSKQKDIRLLPSLKVCFLHSPASNFFWCPAPLLSELSLPDYITFHEKLFCHSIGLFTALPALKQLTFGILSMLCPNSPYQLPKTLDQLKVIEVSRLVLDSLPQARFLVCMIMSSPNLQKLTIRITTDNAPPPSEVTDSLQKLLEPEDQPAGVCCLQHLEELNIQDSRGTQVELDLVRFVLATAPQLRRILIKRAVNLSSEKVVSFSNELVLYKPISKEAEVKYV